MATLHQDMLVAQFEFIEKLTIRKISRIRSK